MDTIEVLVTGASGFIGRWLLAALTQRGQTVGALVRQAEARGPELAAFVAELGGDPRRLRILEGDVERPGLGLGALPKVRDIFHLAAKFSFGLSAAEARRANVDGTLNVLQWAKGRPLRRFVLLGGYRLTRPPRLLDGASYPLAPAVAEKLYRAHGAYEASKYEAYLAARSFAAAHGVPLVAVHPSTVIGDARTGRTLQAFGLAESLQRLYRGALPALAGTRATWVPVVTVDYLAAFLASVPEAQTPPDLVVLDDATPPLAALLRQSAAYWGVPAPRLRLPVALIGALPTRLTGVAPESLHFLSEDRYDTQDAQTHARAVGLKMPDTARSLALWYDNLVATRFAPGPQAPAGRFYDGVFGVGDPGADWIFLHGLPWNGDMWAPVCAGLGAPTLSLDLPGLGRSRVVGADAWHGLLRGPKVLVGHSFGAHEAVRFAAAHPDRVRHLVLVAPAFLQARARLALRIRPLVAWMLGRMTPQKLAARVGLSAEFSPVVSAAGDLARPGVAQRVAAALAQAAQKGERRALRATLAGLKVPVTVIYGEKDPLIAPPGGQIQTYELKGAGHIPQLTHPQEFTAILKKIGKIGDDSGRGLDGF